MEVYLLQNQAFIKRNGEEISILPPQSEQQKRVQESADRSLEDMLRVFQDASASERGSWAEDDEVVVLSQMTPPSSYQEGHTHRNELRNKCLALQAVHQLIGIPQPVSEVLEPLEPNGKPNKAARMLFPENKLPGNLGQFIEAQGEEWASKVNQELNKLIKWTPGGVQTNGKLDPEKVFLNAMDPYGLPIELAQFLWAAGFRPSQITVLEKFKTDKSFAKGLLSRDLEIVKGLLQAGFDPNSLHKNFNIPALCIAAEGGNVNIVNALLAAGARPDGIDILGEGPLGCAMKRGHSNVLYTLLDTLHKAGANPKYSDGQYALLASIQLGKVGAVRALLEAGVEPNFKFNRDISTPFTQAVRSGNVDIVKNLLQFGARPGVGDIKNAAVCGHTEIVKILEAHRKGNS